MKIKNSEVRHIFNRSL